MVTRVEIMLRMWVVTSLLFIGIRLCQTEVDIENPGALLVRLNYDIVIYWNFTSTAGSRNYIEWIDGGLDSFGTDLIFSLSSVGPETSGPAYVTNKHEYMADPDNGRAWIKIKNIQPIDYKYYIIAVSYGSSIKRENVLINGSPAQGNTPRLTDLQLTSPGCDNSQGDTSITTACTDFEIEIPSAWTGDFNVTFDRPGVSSVVRSGIADCPSKKCKFTATNPQDAQTVTIAPILFSLYPQDPPFVFTYTDLCQLDCGNNGVCELDVNNNPWCKCTDGYFGSKCSATYCDDEAQAEKINCAGGTCKCVNPPSCFCDCFTCWQGTRCSEWNSACGNQPCNPSVCQHGGTCSINYQQTPPNHYTCTCPNGYRGANCAEEYGERPCDPSPCQHGGSCTSFYQPVPPHHYSCDCPNGYQGTNCSEVCTILHTDSHIYSGYLGFNITLDVTTNTSATLWWDKNSKIMIPVKPGMTNTFTIGPMHVEHNGTSNIMARNSDCTQIQPIRFILTYHELVVTSPCAPEETSSTACSTSVNHSIQLGDQLEVNLTVTGDPEPEVQWCRCNSTNSTVGSDCDQYDKQYIGNSSKTTSMLVISNASYEDLGIYCGSRLEYFGLDKEIVVKLTLSLPHVAVKRSCLERPECIGPAAGCSILIVIIIGAVTIIVIIKCPNKDKKKSHHVAEEASNETGSRSEHTIVTSSGVVVQKSQDVQDLESPKQRVPANETKHTPLLAPIPGSDIKQNTGPMPLPSIPPESVEHGAPFQNQVSPENGPDNVTESNETQSKKPKKTKKKHKKRDQERLNDETEHLEVIDK